MQNRTGAIQIKPPEIKRKKIETGHYIYGGYHIRKIERPGKRIKYVWEIQDPPLEGKESLSARLRSFRTVSLSRSIAIIEQSRTRIWAMVHQIEAERNSS